MMTTTGEVLKLAPMDAAVIHAAYSKYSPRALYRTQLSQLLGQDWPVRNGDQVYKASASYEDTPSGLVIKFIKTINPNTAAEFQQVWHIPDSAIDLGIDEIESAAIRVK
jgi:hypothetical protein